MRKLILSGDDWFELKHTLELLVIVANNAANESPAFDRGDPVSVMDLFTCCIFKRPAFLRPTRAMREKVLACLANVHSSAEVQ